MHSFRIGFLGLVVSAAFLTTETRAAPYSPQIGMVYSIWQCDGIPASGIPNDIAAANRGILPWGAVGTYHFWGRPDGGYYCPSNNDEVLARHASQLAALGVNYIIVDATNNPAKAGGELITTAFARLVAVFNGIPGAPKIVPWVAITSRSPNYCSGSCPTQSGRDHDMIKYFSDTLNANKNIQYSYQGKPLLLIRGDEGNVAVAPNDAVIATYAGAFTLRKLWAFYGAELAQGRWSYLQECSNPDNFKASQANVPCNQGVTINPSTKAMEQISVTPAYMKSGGDFPMSNTVTSTPKFQGRTLLRQLETAFNNKVPMVVFAGWNEWMATRQNPLPALANRYVDQYDVEFSRDLEPGGGLGPYYFELLRSAIANMRAGNNPTTAMSNLTVPYRVGPFDGQIFDWTEYRTRNPDISGWTYQQALSHWMTNGMREGRVASAEFSSKEYLAMYADLAKAFGSTGYESAISHYVTNGRYEKRAPSFALHTSVFDVVWYQSHNPDIKSMTISQARNHWLHNGQFENRSSSANFTASVYIAKNTDINKLCGAAGYTCAIQHYVLYGRFENRPSH